MHKKTALIAGSTGIVGGNLATRLAQQEDWAVYGLARRPGRLPGVEPIAADLLDPDGLQAALAHVRPTHVYITNWMRQLTEAENIRVNSATVRHLLQAVSGSGSVEHVALATGLKHYLGPFEAYGKGKLPPTPFREDQGRLDLENFYYAQEDEVFSAAARAGFGWSVHRPHTIIGYAVGNAMNMGVTLATFATLCRETGRPFRFPGSTVQWNGITDITDARLLARHLYWASTTASARDQAFNVTNGDVFRWSWMWARIADWFGIPPEGPGQERMPLEVQMSGLEGAWADIASRYSLVEPDLHVLSSAWHTDADLGRPIEVIADMGKSRKLGFLDYQASEESFFDLFAELRTKRLIP